MKKHTKCISMKLVQWPNTTIYLFMYLFITKIKGMDNSVILAVVIINKWLNI